MTEREACSSCGRPIVLEARVCPYCDHGALVDVQLEAPLADQRARYHLARSLSALGPPVGSLLHIQAALAAARPVVVRGITRADARRVMQVLEAGGVPAVVRPSERARPGRSQPARRELLKIAVGIGVLAVIGMSLWAWVRLRPAAKPTVAAGPASAVAANPAPLTSQELARRSIPSTVLLRCTNSLGSGFFVTQDLLLTNAHVLCRQGEHPKVVFSDGRELTGDVLRADEHLDLALVRAEGAGARALPLGDVGGLSIGDKVVLVGSPLGLDFTFHEGSVSNLSRTVLGVAYIQLDAKVNPGNSGGPLLDDRGRVVGVVSLKRGDAEGIGLALPINYAYTGDSPLVAAPAGQGDSPAFVAMLAKGEVEDRKAAAEISSIDLRPALVAARLDDGAHLVVGLARFSRNPPLRQEVSIKVWGGSELVCSLKGYLETWKPVENGAITQSPPRIQAWLQRVGFDYYLYVGQASLRWDTCPREKLMQSIELELEGATPEGARIELF